MNIPSCSLRVLVVLAHPRGPGSLCGALAKAYTEGARDAGAEVQYVDLSRLDFDPYVHFHSPKEQPLEPALRDVKTAIEWADHLVFIYPTWWGTFPALLKGFFDRVLLDGWAFEETSGGTGYRGLLGGRSAELFTTMDTPGPIYSFAMRSPGRNALSRSTLGFCGVDVVRHTRFGVVKASNPDQRSRWIAKSRSLGLSLQHGVHTPLQRTWRRIMPWLAALRLQFYPMTFIAYWVGALLATRSGEIDLIAFAIGYAVLFALEAATVFFNDIHDFESDVRNRFYSMFNGGSRVLVEGRLKPSELRRGAIAALALAFFLSILLVIASDAPLHSSIFMLATLSLLAIFYTVPPIKLSHRSLGEIDVALTHSFGVLFCGYIFQNGQLAEPTPWIVSSLIFFAVLPGITLSAIPDAEADQAANKRTLAVRFSVNTAMSLAALFAATAAILSATFDWLQLAPGTLSGIGVPAIIHGGFLIWFILRCRAKIREATRIDALMVASLGFTIWFAVVPLVNLLG